MLKCQYFKMCLQKFKRCLRAVLAHFINAWLKHSRFIDNRNIIILYLSTNSVRLGPEWIIFFEYLYENNNKTWSYVLIIGKFRPRGNPGEFVSNASPNPINTQGYGEWSRSQKLYNAPTPGDILVTIDENSIHRF